jgi:hypothetical protein
MKVFLTLEASQPSGASCRLAFGCLVPPSVVSMVILFASLF